MILTLPQYADREQRSLVERYGVTLAHAVELYPRRHYRSEWWKYVLSEFNDGGEFTTRQWRALTADERFYVLRTTRALRDNDLTHRMALLAAA